MFNLNATSSNVSTDAMGRPREIRAGGERLTITALETVRDETAAYPVETGPRTVYVVSAADRHFRLVHQLRERRWTVEPVGDRGPSHAHAA